MVDLAKHPILEEMHDLCVTIDNLGASPELTNCVTKASSILMKLDALIPKPLTKELQCKSIQNAERKVATESITLLADGKTVVCQLTTHSGYVVTGLYDALHPSLVTDGAKAIARHDALSQIVKLEAYKRIEDEWKRSNAD